MADNVAITAGAGTTVATDDVSGVHYQRVKLTDPTADSSAAIGVAANPLAVSVGNAAGASAVNIQDGGNTITVDGSVSAACTLAAETTKIIGTVNIAASQSVGLTSGLHPGRAALKSGTASATTTNSTSVIAGTASNYLYITSVVVHNSSTTDSRVTLQDGSGGTSLLVLPAPAKGGAVYSLAVPLLIPTLGNGLFFAAGDAATTMYVSATGYIATT